MRLSVAGHRFYPFLEIIALWPADAAREYDKFFAQLNRLDLELTEIGMFRLLRQTKDKRAMMAHHTAELHIDEIARDLAADMQERDPRERVELARTLQEVSPDSRYALATLIEHDSKATAAQVAEWAKRAPDSPLVLAALAQLHTAQNKPEEAERDLVRFLSMYPECWAYQMLADNYKARGDLNRWQENLERALETEETGLEHTQILVQLADHFMERGEWDKAKDYAEAAGESWASWAMACAQRCAEGQKDWPRAELWASRQSQRYPESPETLFRWFLFCARTGQGELQAARDFTDETIQAVEGAGRFHPSLLAYYQWAKGDLDAALATLREGYRANHARGTCFAIIAVAELTGDRATADEFRKVLQAEHGKEDPKPIQVVGLLPEAVRSGRPDMKAVDQVLATIPAAERPYAEHWVGLFLHARGFKAAARPYLEHGVNATILTEWSRAVAAQILRAGR